MVSIGLKLKERMEGENDARRALQKGRVSNLSERFQTRQSLCIRGDQYSCGVFEMLKNTNSTLTMSIAPTVFYSEPNLPIYQSKQPFSAELSSRSIPAVLQRAPEPVQKSNVPAKETPLQPENAEKPNRILHFFDTVTKWGGIGIGTLGLAAFFTGSATLVAAVSSPFVAGAGVVLGGYYLIRGFSGMWQNASRLFSWDYHAHTAANVWSATKDIVNIALYGVSGIGTALGASSFLLALKPALRIFSLSTKTALIEEATKELAELKKTFTVKEELIELENKLSEEARKNLPALTSAVEESLKKLSNAGALLKDALLQTSLRAKASRLLSSKALREKASLVLERLKRKGEKKIESEIQAAKKSLDDLFAQLQTSQLPENLSTTIYSAKTAAEKVKIAGLKGRDGLVERNHFLDRYSESVRWIFKNRYISWDSHRRAIMGFENWKTFANDSPFLSHIQKELIQSGAKAAHTIFNWIAPSLASVAFVSGAIDLQKQKISFFDILELVMNGVLNISPFITTQLYNRAGRGDPKFNQNPTLSPELKDEMYGKPELKEQVVQRLEKSIPEPSPTGKENTIEGGKKDLLSIEEKIKKLQSIAEENPLKNDREQPSFVQDPEPVPLLKSESSKPPASLNPERKYRYEAHPIEKDTVQKLALRKKIAEMPINELQDRYRSGELSPVDVAQMILSHPDIANGAVFPRVDRDQILSLARASEQRIRAGQEQGPYEGVFVGVKDLFFQLDGKMSGGSETISFRNVDQKPSPLVQQIADAGGIPITVGMTTAANGGSGLYNGFGVVPHPTRAGYDTAGSSSSSARVVGMEDLPIRLSVGSDTGGSVTAPGGAAGLYTLVPESGMIPMNGMLPFAPHLDRPGILGRNLGETEALARFLSRASDTDPRMRYPINEALQARYQPANEKPLVVYLKTLVEKSSAAAKQHFEEQLQALREKGYRIVELDARFDPMVEIPMELYPYDAYPVAGFAHTNPLQNGNGWEAPRYTLNPNLNGRLARGKLYIEHGIFDRALEIHREFQSLIQRILGDKTVMISPSCEAVPTNTFYPGGKSGSLLDGHDLITMLKNRILGWGQVNLPSDQNNIVGVAASGPLPEVMRLSHDLKTPTVTIH